MLAPFLKPSDCIGIAASSSVFSREEFLKGVSLVEGLGYRTYYRSDIFSSHRGFAGDDARRLDELHELFAAPEIKAILFARGGWGLQRIISKLDLDLIRKNPKLILGYSDLTTLHLFLYAKLKWPFFYGPVIARALSATEPNSFKHALASLASALDGSILANPLSLSIAETLHAGTAQAPIAGGCLTLIATASGTPYGIPFKDHILFVEDVGEKPYRIDRMLTHLRETGRLDGVRGLICGAFKDCGDESELKQIILEHFEKENIPILWNTPYGHRTNMQTLPLGIPVTLDTHPIPILRFLPLTPTLSPKGRGGL